MIVRILLISVLVVAAVPSSVADEKRQSKSALDELFAKYPAKELTFHYVVVTGELINIRTQPNTSSLVVGEARKGDILEYGGNDDGDWHEVILYSGVTRYVHESLVKPVVFEPIVPADKDALSRLYEKYLWVEKRATRIADAEVPHLSTEEVIALGPIAEDVGWERLEKRGIVYQQVLDFGMLEICHLINIQPASCYEISMEFIEQGFHSPQDSR